MQKTRRSRKNLPGEEWRPVPGYEGLYEVSSLGRVKSLERTARDGGASCAAPARILLQSRSDRGYCSVRLCRDGSCTTFGVHVLVCLAFVGDRPDGNSVVHHKDGIADNNSVGNLEWRTLSDCVAHEDIQKRRVATRRGKGPWDNRPRPVEIVDDGHVAMRFRNARQAAKLTGFCATTIHAQCKGRKSRRPGFQWRYAEETKEG